MTKRLTTCFLLFLIVVATATAIAEVLDLLAKFQPTKIVVEAPPEEASLQANYESYLKGEYKLSARER